MTRPDARQLKKNLKEVTVGSRTRDILIFLFFVLICTIFWFVRELADSFSTEIVMPVQLTDVPEGIIITTDVPHEIRLTLHDKGVELVPLLLRGSTASTIPLPFSTVISTKSPVRGMICSLRSTPRPRQTTIRSGSCTS